eukprot:3702072-Alexandrium_andersonii.AAC.1
MQKATASNREHPSCSPSVVRQASLRPDRPGIAACSCAGNTCPMGRADDLRPRHSTLVVVFVPG